MYLIPLYLRINLKKIWIFTGIIALFVQLYIWGLKPKEWGDYKVGVDYLEKVNNIGDTLMVRELKDKLGYNSGKESGVDGGELNNIENGKKTEEELKQICVFCGCEKETFFYMGKFICGQCYSELRNKYLKWHQKLILGNKFLISKEVEGCYRFYRQKSRWVCAAECWGILVELTDNIDF